MGGLGLKRPEVSGDSHGLVRVASGGPGFRGVKLKNEICFGAKK